MKKIWVCLFFVSFAAAFLGWGSLAGAEDQKEWKLDVALPGLGLSWKPLSTTLRADVSGVRMILSRTSKTKFDVYLGRLRLVLGSAHSLLRIADLLLQVSGYKGNDAEALIKQAEERLIQEVRRQFESQEYETSYQAFLRAEYCQKASDLTCTMREMNSAWIAALRGVEKHKKTNLYKWLSLSVRIGLYWRLLIQKHQHHPEIREWKRILPDLDTGFASLGKAWTQAPSLFRAEETGFVVMKKCSYQVATPFLTHAFRVGSDGIGCKHLEKDKAIEREYKKRIAFQLARAIQNKQHRWYQGYAKTACGELQRRYRHIGLSAGDRCAFWEGCSGKHTYSCGYTGLLYYHHRDSKSALYFYKGCQHRDALACLGMAHFHESKATTRPVLRKQAIESYKRACFLRNVFGCRRLADMLSHLPDKEQTPKSSKVYAFACGMGDADSCNKRASRAAFPSYESLRFHSKACMLWDGDGCFKAGVAAFAISKLDDAIFFLGRACVKNIPGSCEHWKHAQTLKQSGQLCMRVGERQFCR